MSRGPVEIVSYSGVTISDPTVNTTAKFGTPAASKTATAWYRATH
jgi:hypothetical protein